MIRATDSVSAELYRQKNRLTLPACEPSLCQAEALYVASPYRAWAADLMHDAELGYSFVSYTIIIGILMDAYFGDELEDMDGLYRVWKSALGNQFQGQIPC